MSPELETLDQLLCGAMPLRVIRGLYPSATTFNSAMLAMLSAGDLRLLDGDGKDIPHWNWRSVFDGERSAEAGSLMLDLTEQGARKMS
jgi:hypothetical protein